MLPLRQNTSTTIVVGPFLSPTDGVSPVLGLAAPAPSKVYLTKGGTAAAYPVGMWTEIGNGLYAITLSTTDSGSPGRLRIDFQDAAGYVSVFHEFGVLNPAAYDFLYGTSALPVNATQWGGINVAGMPLPAANYTAPDNGSVAAIKLKTDALPASPASTSDIQAGLSAQGYTPARAVRLDNCDAAVSSRLAANVYTPPPGVNAIASAILSVPANKLATDTAGTVSVNLAQPVPVSNAAQTVGDALNAARAQGFGAWSLDANARTLDLFGGDGTTVVRTFALDSVTNPSSRI